MRIIKNLRDIFNLIKAKEKYCGCGCLFYELLCTNYYSLCTYLEFPRNSVNNVLMKAFETTNNVVAISNCNNDTLGVCSNNIFITTFSRKQYKYFNQHIYVIRIEFYLF